MSIITNGLTQDGFGARLQRAINTMSFTFYLNDKYNTNIEYVHTPFSYEGFGEDFSLGERDREIGDNRYPYDEITREGYLKRANLWDSFVNYQGKIITDIDLNTYNIIDEFDYQYNKLFYDIHQGETKNNIYVVKYLQSQLNNGFINFNNIDFYYDQIKKRIPIIEKEHNNEIIIHIRRKDAINFGYDRFLSDEYYLDLLDKLKSFKEKYKITIHTQRKNFDYNKYCGWDICYDDEIEDYDLFKKMVNCKVLVVGKSSFSIAAAMLNKNIIVYPEQPTRKLDRWINKINFFNLIENYGL